MKDEEIIALYWERNQTAILATADKYGKLLQYIANQIVKDYLDVEECVNDTYLKAWNSIPPQRPSYLQAFLGTIVRNLALDRYKEKHAKKRVPAEIVTLLSELEEVQPAILDEAWQKIEEKELARHISDFVRSQSTEKRNIFIRRYWFCEDIKLLAKHFNCSESKIKASLFRTREQLKVYLEKEEIWI